MSERFRVGARVFCSMASDKQHRKAGIVEVLRDGPHTHAWPSVRGYWVKALTDIRSWPASDRAGARVLWYCAGDEFPAAAGILTEVTR